MPGQLGRSLLEAQEAGRRVAMEVGALRCMAAMTPFRQTRGVRHCALLGVRFWASSAPNWAMGLEAKSFHL